MPRPYSTDLRTRVLRAAEGGEPIRAVARRFGVSASFVSKLRNRFRRTGSVEPDKQGGDHRSHGIEAHGEWILDELEKTPDMILAEFQSGLAGRGLRVGASTVWRFFERHEMTVKKRPRTPPSSNATT